MCTTRIRKKMQGTADRPRLNVYRSLNHIYVQVIDDLHGKTLVSASTAEGKKEDRKTGGNVASAKAVGKTIAERAKAKGYDAGGVRPWRLHLSRARQSGGRCSARSGIEVLEQFSVVSSQFSAKSEFGSGTALTGELDKNANSH